MYASRLLVDADIHRLRILRKKIRMERRTIMRTREYFKTRDAAWHFLNLLPKSRYEITDYGIDASHDKEPYYVEYIDRPKYTR